MYSPVVIPTLCRAQKFIALVESLAVSPLAKETELFIGLDFPPSPKYEEGYAQISSYIQTLTGFKSVHVIRRETNMGAIDNIKDLLATVCRTHDRFIFTEDDNVFAPAFLEYVNAGLTRFEGDKSIASISGYSYPVSYTHSNTTVIKMQRYFSDWGFGTWRDRYEEARDTITNEFFQNVYKNKKLAKKLRTASKKNYTRAFGFRTEAEVRPYDFTNSCAQILLDRYTIMPKKTLVRNTGWDNTGLHYNDQNSPLTRLLKEQELDTREHWPSTEFIFDEEESKAVNALIDKSPIGAYETIPYLKTRIKEVLYRHGLYGRTS